MLRAIVDRAATLERVGVRTELVSVGMGRARHLPEAEPVGVGLAGLHVVEQRRRDVGLGLEHQCRHVEVVADDRRGLANESAG